MSLKDFETGSSLISCSFNDVDPTLFVVGTAFALPNEPEPTRGRILVLRVVERKFVLVCETEVKGTCVLKVLSDWISALPVFSLLGARVRMCMCVCVCVCMCVCSAFLSLTSCSSLFSSLRPPPPPAVVASAIVPKALCTH
jgi:CPSF A subunit region